MITILAPLLVIARARVGLVTTVAEKTSVPSTVMVSLYESTLDSPARICAVSKDGMAPIGGVEASPPADGDAAAGVEGWAAEVAAAEPLGAPLAVEPPHAATRKANGSSAAAARVRRIIS